MIEVSVDELTIVFRLNKDCKNHFYNKYMYWENIAEIMIHLITKQAEFESVFGEKKEQLNKPEGYTKSYTFGNHSFYFAIGYHSYHSEMGIIIKFSARALDFYIKNTNITIPQFLSKVQSEYYITRLSRIDIAVDYINEQLDLNDIYKGLSNGTLVIRYIRVNKNNNPCLIKHNAILKSFINGSNIETIYVGNKSSERFLRIYDKKKEQLNNKYSDLKKLSEVVQWIRFEAVFRGRYAHEITEILLNSDNEKYIEILSNIFIQKYMFFTESNNFSKKSEITQKLEDSINNKEIILKEPRISNNELNRSYKYILEGSGLMSLMFKLDEIFGSEASINLINDIWEYYSKYYLANSDIMKWLELNKDIYREKYDNINEFLNNQNFNNNFIKR